MPLLWDISRLFGLWCLEKTISLETGHLEHPSFPVHLIERRRYLNRTSSMRRMITRALVGSILLISCCVLVPRVMLWSVTTYSPISSLDEVSRCTGIGFPFGTRLLDGRADLLRVRVLVARVVIPRGDARTLLAQNSLEWDGPIVEEQSAYLGPSPVPGYPSLSTFGRSITRSGHRIGGPGDRVIIVVELADRDMLEAYIIFQNT